MPVLLFLICLLLQSCVATREDVAGLEVQIARLEKSAGALEKKQAELSVRLDEIKRPVENLNSNLNDTQNLLNNFTPRFEELRTLINAARKDLSGLVDQSAVNAAQKLEETEKRLNAQFESLSNLVKKAAAAKTKAQAPAPPASKSSSTGKANGGNGDADDDPTEAPIRLFQAAYKDYLAKRWDLAEAGFSNYLKTYPEGSLGDKSLYYKAIALKEQKQISEAHKTLDKLLDSYAKSPTAKGGMLEKAKLYMDDKKYGEAEGMLEYLAITFPNSDEAKEAKEILKAIPHK